MPVQPVLGTEVPLTLPATPGVGGRSGGLGGGGSGSAVGGELRLLAQPLLLGWARGHGSDTASPSCAFPTTEERRKQRPCGWSLVGEATGPLHPAQVLLLPGEYRFTDSPQMEVREAWTPRVPT